MWDEITYPFLNFNGFTVEVLEWISNFISHCIGHAITYPWCLSKLVKGTPVGHYWVYYPGVLPLSAVNVYNEAITLLWAITVITAVKAIDLFTTSYCLMHHQWVSQTHFTDNFYLINAWHGKYCFVVMFSCCHLLEPHFKAKSHCNLFED